VRACRVGVDRRVKGFSFPQVAAQSGVEHGGRPALAQCAGTGDGLGDGGVDRDTGVLELVEADQEQRAYITVLGSRRAMQQLYGQCRQTWLPAQCAVTEFTDQGAVVERNFLQSVGEGVVE